MSIHSSNNLFTHLSIHTRIHKSIHPSIDWRRSPHAILRLVNNLWLLCCAETYSTYQRANWVAALLSRLIMLSFRVGLIASWTWTPPQEGDLRQIQEHWWLPKHQCLWLIQWLYCRVRYLNHMTLQENISQHAARQFGFAGNDREAEKQWKYSNKQLPTGRKFNCVPLWGSEASTYTWMNLQSFHNGAQDQARFQTQLEKNCRKHQDV